MLGFLVERDDRIIERDHFAIDAQAGEAAGARVEQVLSVLTFALPFEWRVQHQLGALGVFQDRGHDLLGRLPFGLSPALGAKLHPDAGVQHAQIVVHLRHGADSRARVARGRFLLDRDGRRQPANGVVLRLVHLPQKLPCVAGQALDVTALPLGVDGVERERRLTAARHARDHHQALLGDREGDVLEIVLARTAHDDGFRFSIAHRHGVALRPRRCKAPRGGSASLKVEVGQPFQVDAHCRQRASALYCGRAGKPGGDLALDAGGSLMLVAGNIRRPACASRRRFALSVAHERLCCRQHLEGCAALRADPDATLLSKGAPVTVRDRASKFTDAHCAPFSLSVAQRAAATAESYNVVAMQAPFVSLKSPKESPEHSRTTKM